MKRYLPNSNEAIARLLAMFIITDGHVDPKEIESLEHFGIYEALNIGRKGFSQVLIDYCNDVSSDINPDDGAINLLSVERIDSMLDDVTDRNKRLLTCAIALDLCKSDGTINKQEMTLLRHMMKYWQITLDDLEKEFIHAKETD